MNIVTTPITNLLVIDSQVSDWQSLASAATAGTAVLILDSGSDGLTQISDYLTAFAASTADFVPLQSIQIMSHGSAGSLLLGSSTISQDNLSLYSEQLGNMGSSLSATGDILLYGCDVAADQNGVDFINQLAVLTNADVAASNDLTGSAALGGDWQLETSTGTIESALALNTATLNSYKDILNISTLDGISELFMSVYDSTSGNTYSFDTGLTIDAFITAASNAAYTYTFDLSSDANWTSGFLGAAGFNAATTSYALIVGSNVYTDVLITSSAAGGLVLTDTIDALISNIQIQAGQINGNGIDISKVVNDGDIVNTGQFNNFDNAFGLQTGAQIAGAYGSALAFFHATNVPNAAGDALESHVEQYAGSWTLSGNTLTYAKAVTANNAPTGTVTIIGTAEQNQLLTADISTLADADNLGTISYQWFAGENAITNATNSILALTQAEVGKVITVQASYTDGQSNLEKVLSSATTAVVDVNDAPTGTVTISGLFEQNQILTAANTLVDLDGMGTVPITYQWLADGIAIQGATAATWTLTQEQVGKAITVQASYTDGLNKLEQVLSSATTAITDVNDLPTGTVTITGTAEQNQILTAANTLVDLDGMGTVPITYQWFADGVLITNATGETFTLTQEQVNKAITVQASYTDGLNKLEQVLSSATASVGQFNNPHTGTVTISGLVEQNQLLTAANTLGDSDGMGTVPITYQWFADGVLITNATAGTFTLTQEQVNKVITVQASYTDGLNKLEQVLSSATTAVVDVNDAPTGIVTISGLLEQNQLLTAANTLGDLDGMGTVPITYQWFADGVLITNATAGTFTLTQEQVNKVITVQASYTDGLNKLEQVLSSATTAITDVNDLPTGTVTITGTAEQNQILTAANTLGDLDGMGTVPIAYQWFADGVLITNATGETFTLTQEQVNKAITVQASYTDGLSNPETKLSSATTAVVNVNDLPTGAVTISGLIEQNQILTAANTLVDLDGMGTTPITYQWLADGIAIEGATGETFTLTQEQVNKAITVQASYTDGLSNPETKLSSATTAVVNVNDLPTGAVTISGTARKDQILTAAIITLADADGLGNISYQWSANGTEIGGATASTFTLTQDQVDKAITVRASYTDLQGTPEFVISSATTQVGVNHAPTTSDVTLLQIFENSQLRIITQAELIINAVDLDGDVRTATSLSITSGNGTLVDNVDGTWSYTPVLNDTTSVSFSYTITDSVSPTAGTVAAIATLDITPVNATPEAGLFKSFSNGVNTYIKAEAYVQNPGQNLDLDYQIYDKSPDAIVIGSTSNDYINMAGTGNKAANGGGGNDVIDGTTGSSFLSGGDGLNTFFMDGRAAGVTWSTLTDFDKGQDKATIWGWVKGVSTINAGFTDFNTGGATGYTGLTLHVQNLLPEGSASGATNSALNSLTLTGHTLAEFGASSLADLNTQIINGTNTHFIVGQTIDNLGVHDYLLIS
ncbi:DUF4347 domain-containing protein [Methylobacter sp. S3L5C]|uniref:DUF4347 domain-containing protein n=1 Tax=Methylobacter sp. S3L5C TaxID=2839024 RepID=UPI001FAE351D|nr:DUF4347 domain-containing protein [Methylobacter sp. S3L5C]UOA10521.1 DUF4347 domain-containing protein [Methylobacter sp. S3L5C]